MTEASCCHPTCFDQYSNALVEQPPEDQFNGLLSAAILLKIVENETAESESLHCLGQSTYPTSASSKKPLTAYSLSPQPHGTDNPYAGSWSREQQRGMRYLCVGERVSEKHGPRHMYESGA